MKFKLFSLVALIVLGSINISIAGGTKSTTKASASTTLASFVQDHVDYPEFLIEDGVNKACMLIEFSIDADGDIQVLNTNQSDFRIRAYVLEQIQHVNLSSSEYVQGQTYMLKLNFKLL
jgi:hypothetical protein